MLDRTAQIPGSRNATALLAEGFPPRAAPFSTGFCIGGTLAQGVAVMRYAEMEDIATDGLVEHGRVKEDKI